MSSKFAPKFIHPHYAVMRHSRLAPDKKRLEEGSMRICAEVSIELANVVRGKQVRIYHSPLERAA